MAALALVLVTAISFAACGNSSKITLAEFDDEFIAQILIYGISNGTSTTGDFDGNIVKQSGSLYSWENYYKGDPTTEVAEFDQCKWDACVEIALDKPTGDDGMIRADLMDAELDVSNLKVVVSGQEIDLINSNSANGKLLAQVYDTPGQWRYYAIIENISADTQIQFTGHVQAI